MLRGPAAVLLLVLLLPGCAKPPAADDPTAALDSAAQQVDVAPTSSTGIIRGIVVDDALHPLPGALVALRDGGNTTSGTDGAFGFQTLLPGTHFVTASKPGYTSVQQSVTVDAAIPDPPVVRIQLKGIAGAMPFVEAYHTKLISDMAVCTDATGCETAGGAITNPGGVFGDTSHYVSISFNPNATVAQTELHWDPMTQADDAGWFECNSANNHDKVDYQETAGPPPLIVRINATKALQDHTAIANGMGCQWQARPGSFPVAVVYGQTLDAYTHIFYNFMPRADWQFGRDGDYPVPGG